jgi:hypothetical protein
LTLWGKILFLDNFHLFLLPNLEVIEEMDKQRKKAIESLEISCNSVKCQKSGLDVPILGKWDRPQTASSRIAVLEQVSSGPKDIE